MVSIAQLFYRTAPRPKPFVLAVRLHKQVQQPQKSVVGSSPGEDDFCSWETRTIKEKHQDQSCLLQQGDSMNKGHNPEKLPWFKS
jgi:hypothetical protein